MCKQLMVCLIVCGFVGGSASAAAVIMGTDTRNTIAGTSAIGIVVDGAGVDWTGAVLKIDLTAGSVYNDAGFGSDAPQEALWGFVPALQWDSYVGIPGDGTGGIAGGAGDLGGGPLNIGGTGVDAVSVTWFNTRTTDTGPILIGNITVTDDVAGTIALIVSFADGTLLQSGRPIVGGLLNELPPPYPEPGMLAVLGVGGLGLMRRGRRRR
jgi:MYXO-CTERM domain-containing protein